MTKKRMRNIGVEGALEYEDKSWEIWSPGGIQGKGRKAKRSLERWRMLQLRGISHNRPLSCRMQYDGKGKVDLED
jgi:hypothetical protein